MHMVDIAVQLHSPLGTGFLVQAIHVLCDDSGDESSLLQSGQCQMRRVDLCLRGGFQKPEA